MRAAETPVEPAEPAEPAAAAEPVAPPAARANPPWAGGGGGEQGALYTFRLSDYTGPEYVSAAEDVLRTVVIQLVVQVLVAASDEGTPFFSGVFWLLILYIIVGTVAYHVLARRLLRFA